MALMLTAAPGVEPVTLAEAKAHLRREQTNEDVLIGSLIVTSRLHVEAALALALITQSWRLLLDRWPSGDAVELPLSPLQAVGAVRVKAQRLPVREALSRYAEFRRERYRALPHFWRLGAGG